VALIVVFVNKSNLAPVSDYTVEVLVGDGSAERSKMIYRGVVNDHERALGWEMLLQQFVAHLPVTPFEEHT